MIEDKELIARVVGNNDHHAFRCLVAKYQSGIRQLLRRLTAGDRHFADDLAQETFITLYKKLYLFRAESTLSTWLHKIAYNHFLKSQQKAFKRYEQTEINFDEFESSNNNLDKDLIIEKLMQQLSSLERACITLSISVGMSHIEIAHITELPLGTVKSHIHRAQQKLKSFVKKSNKGEENEEHQ